MYLPLAGVLKPEWKPEYDTSERGTRDTNYSANFTTRKSSAEFKGQFFNDTSPQILALALGADAVTQPDKAKAPTVYRHDFVPADNLKPATIFKSYDAQVYTSSLNYVEKFDIKIVAESKLFEFNASTMGQYPKKLAGAAPTPKYTLLKAFAGYAPQIQLNGTKTTDINEFTFNYAQKLTPWYAIAESPDMSLFYPGERTVTVDFTARFDTTVLADLRDGDPALFNPQDFHLNLVVKGEPIANAGTMRQEFGIDMPIINFDSLEWDLGKDNVLVKAKATCRPTLTSPSFTMYSINEVATYGL